ncbi:MAG: sugar phosphate isomerase/epimerase [Dehalococcoidales bacterium]|nr:MAG: sugar phosphate isomerase/epimerase [Dehalococcoidales bacterium]
MEDNWQAALSYQPVIALSARWQTYPKRFQWIRENGFALEYGPNPDALTQVARHIDRFLKEGIPVRYHGFFPDYEIGHIDDSVSERAVQLHKSALQAIHGLGQPVITVHIGLNPDDEIDAEKAVDNLGYLVDYASSLGITLCLENLRRGPTSHPETVTTWAEKSGTMITFDVGHAVSSQRVVDGELTVIDFLRMVAPRLVEAHVYERELDRHYPPTDMAVLGPVIDFLLETGCRWWTLELDNYSEALDTRDLLVDYLKKRNTLVPGEST